MDESRAAVRSISPGEGCWAFESPLPPGAIGNFDHELTEEFFRALAEQRQADAAHHDRGRHATPTT